MIRPFLTFATAIALVTPALAQDYPPAPPIGTPKPFKVPATETYTLPNGMRVTLVPFGIVPKANISLRVFAGNLNEAKDIWLADVTADMLKEGAGGKSSAQIASAAAAMGGNLGVGVSTQSTSIGLNILSEHAPDAVGLIADVALRPQFPATEIDRVKANRARGLSVALSQAGPVADAALGRAYYGDHPYGALFPTAAQLSAYSLDDVKAFYAANFGAKRAHLYVAGQFDVAAVKAAIAAAFGGWAAGPERLSLVPTPKVGPQVILVDRPGAPQSTLRLAFPAPVAGSAGDIPLRVTDALLGGSFGSRITKNIREAKGYTYSPYSDVSYYPGNSNWTFNADVTVEATGPSLTEVFGEIRTLQGTAPGDEEAAGMRSYLAGLFTFRNSTAGSLVGSLAERETLGLPDNWLDQYVPSVLAVTPAQIQASAKATMPLDKMTLVVVGDLKTVTPQLKQVKELANATFQTVTVP